MGRVRLCIAIAAAVAIAWSSVADNPVLCPDEAGGVGEHGRGEPSGPHCCLNGPCHTPTVVRATTADLERTASITAYVSIPAEVLRGIDRPAPPTPPPTILV